MSLKNTELKQCSLFTRKSNNYFDFYATSCSWNYTVILAYRSIDTKFINLGSKLTENTGGYHSFNMELVEDQSKMADARRGECGLNKSLREAS